MAEIGKIDRNLAVTGGQTDHLRFYHARKAPFTLYGLLSESENAPFCRIPETVAEKVSEGVLGLCRNTAGGRIRFRTDSSCVAIKATMPGKCLMPHMPFTGSSGFDLYEITDGEYCYKGTFIPPIDRGRVFTSVIDLETGKMRELVIHFPLYDDVDDLRIGLEPDARLEAGGSYENEKPVIFYGSSITQGGCASRPGNAYPNLISQRLNLDHRNLGFSGSARGEQEMAQYIARQDMSIFVMDYDHNSALEELRERHEQFFLTIREQKPDLPVILATRTMIPRTGQMTRERDDRREVILQTYENALRRGDAKVLFVDGREVYRRAERLGVCADSCTVDGIHPSDLGFACMAEAFGEAIVKIRNFSKESV